MTSHDEMPCPTCGVSLVMSDRQGIEIDYCPKCRGVWLDRGELDKILERSLAAAVPADNRDLLSAVCPETDILKDLRRPV